MKIVKILGGLGNQMFQYALYVALKERFPNERVMIDTSCFRGYPLHNGYEIDNIFSLSSDVASCKDIVRVAYPYPNYRCWQVGKYLLPKRKTTCVERKDFAFDNTVLQQEGDRYFDGYWQHEEYFAFAKEKVLRAFTFPQAISNQNKDTIERALTENSMSIHIRRGDYVSNPFYKGICDTDYYRRAIAYCQETVAPSLYCIFSNDIAWCKKELSAYLPANKVVYIDWNMGHNSYVDMQIMSCCKHNITANSSFSWWGAWLNRNPQKTVVAPSKWMNTKLDKDPIPNTWIKI